MRIIIDMQGAQTPFSRNRGVGRYTIELVKAIALNSRGHEIILALNGAFPDTIEPIRAEFDEILSQDNIRVWQQFLNTAAIVTKNTWSRKAGEILREEFLNSLKGDIVFSTNLQEGFFDNSCTSVKMLPTNSLICSTLHDVIPLIYPNRYLCDPVNRAWYMEKIDFVKNSDLVITVSYASREGISQLLAIPDEKIYVIYNGVNHDKFRPINIGIDDKNKLLTKMNISHPFIMYAGGSDLHKNLDALYSAFSKLPQNILCSHQLVMVGEGPKREQNRYHNKLKKMGVSDNVIFVGQVCDEDLIMLYNLCDLFVYPSINEGFGLPPLEAMACGATVLASETSSLPEVVGCQDALFDPNDDVCLAQKIERVLTDKNFKNLLRDQEIRHASNFSWENSAKTLLSIFEKIVDNNFLIQPSLPRPDPTQAIIGHVASMNSNIPFEDTELKLLSSSIAESFCSRKECPRRMFLDVSSIINLDHLSGSRG